MEPGRVELPSASAPNRLLIHRLSCLNPGNRGYPLFPVAGLLLLFLGSNPQKGISYSVRWGYLNRLNGVAY